MTAETASQPDTPSPAETPAAPAARAQDSTQDGTQDRSQEVVMALLTQQEALLAELRWAYDELERTQDSEIVQLKSRLARIEEQAGLASGAQGAQGAAASVGASGSSGSAASSSFAARTRRRVELSLQDPERAVREVGRRLRRPIDRIARRTGISR